MTDARATEHFVEKWWQREPEMRVADAFSAGADPGNATARLRFQCWGALLHELREAVFELPDPGVAAAKRGWWAEDLQGVAFGRARHPLTLALAGLDEAQSAPWTGLSLAVVGAGGEARQPDTAQALAALQPLAQAAIAVENALFRVRDDGGAAERSLAVHWLLQRLPRGLDAEDGARVPMHLLARHGITLAQLTDAPDALLQDWAAELSAAVSEPPRGAFIRRARYRFDRPRLEKLQRKVGGHGGYWLYRPSPLGTLWRAWRAARGP